MDNLNLVLPEIFISLSIMFLLIYIFTKKILQLWGKVIENQEKEKYLREVME